MMAEGNSSNGTERYQIGSCDTGEYREGAKTRVTDHFLLQHLTGCLDLRTHYTWAWACRHAPAVDS